LSLVDELVKEKPRWIPIKGRQLQGYLSEADELFYGGAAGGGKSDLLLGLALTAHTRSIIYRREFPQFEFMIERLNELLDFEAGDVFMQHKHRVITHDNKLIQLASIPFLQDVTKYQGRPYDLVAFDEVTNFLYPMYQFLKAWNRTVNPNQRCRVVVTGNPPEGADGDWVLDLWAPWIKKDHPDFPEKPGKLRWYAMMDGKEVEVKNNKPIKHKGELLFPFSRTFIPAHVSDNPFYKNTDYERKLMSLPEPFRSKLYKGDFGSTQEDDPYQVIPSRWLDMAIARWKPQKPQMIRKKDGKQEKIDVPLSSLGVDVARGGNDATVIMKRYDTWFAKPLAYEGRLTPDGQSVVALVIKEIDDSDSDPDINIDVIGIGSSVYDLLNDDQYGYNVVPINSAEKSLARDRTNKYGFANKRSELWWLAREALDPDHGDGLAVPPDGELRADLLAPRFKVTARGIQVESKDEIKKRIGRSTNKGDAFIYSLDMSSKPGLLV